MVEILLNDLSDHETHINFRGERQYAETTPLLGIFLLRNDIHWLRIRLLVSFLILVLIAGIVIGIYLLVIQVNSENVLPPLTSEQSVASHKQRINKIDKISTMDPRRMVIIVQADNNETGDSTNYTNLLDSAQASEQPLHYNFLVSPTGQISKALGWETKSKMFPEFNSKYLVVAFIGNFTEEAPTDLQVLEATTFLEDAVRDEQLTPDYIIVGKKIKEFPKYLFIELSKLPQWSDNLSDIE